MICTDGTTCFSLGCKYGGCQGRRPERIVLAPADYDAAKAAIDNPPPPSDTLRGLLTSPAPWDAPREILPRIDEIAATVLGIAGAV